MFIRAAVLEELNAPLVLRDLETRRLETGQVLVGVERSGICGAQLGEIAGVKGADKFLPHLMGHEGAGFVLECGPGVTRFKGGDRVVMHWRKGPGIDAPFPKYDGVDGTVYGGGSCTTFNTGAVVSENRLTKIDWDIPYEIAALMGCAVTTGLGIITREAKVSIGQSIIVIGAGGVGLNILQAAALVSADPIIAIDITPQKLTQARMMGATHDILWRVDDPEYSIGEIWNILGRGGADHVIDTTGKPQMIEQGYELTGPSGQMFLVAQVRHDQKISIQPLAMHSGKHLWGSDGGKTEPHIDIPRYLKLFRSGKLRLDRLITHRAPLDDVNQLLDSVRRGEVGRAVLSMNPQTTGISS